MNIPKNLRLSDGFIIALIIISKLRQRGTFAFQPVFSASCNATIWLLNMISDH